MTRGAWQSRVRCVALGHSRSPCRLAASLEGRGERRGLLSTQGHPTCHCELMRCCSLRRTLPVPHSMSREVDSREAKLDPPRSSTTLPDRIKVFPAVSSCASQRCRSDCARHASQTARADRRGCNRAAPSWPSRWCARRRGKDRPDCLCGPRPSVCPSRRRGGRRGVAGRKVAEARRTSLLLTFPPPAGFATRGKIVARRRLAVPASIRGAARSASVRGTSRGGADYRNGLGNATRSADARVQHG